MNIMAYSLRVGGEETLPQVDDFKYLGVLFSHEGKIEREIDRQIGSDVVTVPVCHGAGTAESKGDALDLRVD